MSNDVTWGDVMDALSLGSHDRINMTLETLQVNIGKRCQIVETCMPEAKGKEGFIIDVDGSHNRFRYTVELDQAIKTSKHCTPFRKIYVPTTSVVIGPEVKP